MMLPFQFLISEVFGAVFLLLGIFMLTRLFAGEQLKNQSMLIGAGLLLFALGHEFGEVLCGSGFHGGTPKTLFGSVHIIFLGSIGSIVFFIGCYQFQKQYLRNVNEAIYSLTAQSSTIQAGAAMDNNTLYREMIEQIVQKVRSLLANIAITQANVVPGLVVSNEGRIIKIERDPADVLEDLVARYGLMMGPVAIRLAKNAVQPVLAKKPDLKLPAKLMG